MKKQVRYIGVLLAMICVVTGCGSKEPEVPPSDVTTAYLEALKTQNSEEAAKYSLSGKGENFTLTSEEVASLGMDVASAQSFLAQIMDFEYVLDGESVYLAEEQASVTLKIKTYDVNAVVTQSIEDNKTKFQEISASKDSDEAKQIQISNIIIADFGNVDRTIEKSYTMQLKLVENEWKVKDVDESFYNTILNIE